MKNNMTQKLNHRMKFGLNVESTISDSFFPMLMCSPYCVGVTWM